MKTKTIILVLIAFVSCLMLAQDAPRGFRNPADVVMMTTTATTSTNPFSPADVSGLKVWLKSESLSGSDGTEITQWNDSSGNNYHATNSTGNCPCITNNVFGTYEAAYFNGSSTNMLGFSGSALGILNNVSGVTIFMAISRVAAVANAKFIYFSTNTVSSGTRLSFGASSGTSGSLMLSSRSPDTQSTQSSDSGTLTAAKQVIVAQVDYPSSACYIYTNLLNLVSDSTFTCAATTDASDSKEIVIGGNLASSVYAKFYCGELIIYNRLLTGSERTNVTQYITTKLGL